MSSGSEKIIYSMMRVSKFYQNKTVLKDISLSYFYGAKIGVLGLNGSGKSSLLRVMAGFDQEYNGQAVLSPGYTLGFLEQEPVLDHDKTVQAVVEEGMRESVGLVREYNEISEKFAEPMPADEMNALIERQGELQEKSTKVISGISIPVLRWPWMPCAVLRETLPSGFFPAVRKGGWPSAGCCCRNRISCSWTNRRIIWMPKRWPGSSVISSNMKGR